MNSIVAMRTMENHEKSNKGVDDQASDRFSMIMSMYNKKGEGRNDEILYNSVEFVKNMRL